MIWEWVGFLNRLLLKSQHLFLHSCCWRVDPEVSFVHWQSRQNPLSHIGFAEVNKTWSSSISRLRLYFPAVYLAPIQGSLPLSKLGMTFFFGSVSTHHPLVGGVQQPWGAALIPPEGVRRAGWLQSLSSTFLEFLRRSRSHEHEPVIFFLRIGYLHFYFSILAFHLPRWIFCASWAPPQCRGEEADLCRVPWGRAIGLLLSLREHGWTGTLGWNLSLSSRSFEVPFLWEEILRSICF